MRVGREGRRPEKQRRAACSMPRDVFTHTHTWPAVVSCAPHGWWWWQSATALKRVVRVARVAGGRGESRFRFESGETKNTVRRRFSFQRRQQFLPSSPPAYQVAASSVLTSQRVYRQTYRAKHRKETVSNFAPSNDEPHFTRPAPRLAAAPGTYWGRQGGHVDVDVYTLQYGGFHAHAALGRAQRRRADFISRLLTPPALLPLPTPPRRRPLLRPRIQHPPSLALAFPPAPAVAHPPTPPLALAAPPLALAPLQPTVALPA